MNRLRGIARKPRQGHSGAFTPRAAPLLALVTCLALVAPLALAQVGLPVEDGDGTTAPGTLRVAVDPTNLTLEPGGNASFAAVVHHDGNTSAWVNLSLVNLPRGWHNPVNGTKVELKAGEARHFTFTLHAPADAEPGTSFHAGFVAAYAGMPETAVGARLRVDVVAPATGPAPEPPTIHAAFMPTDVTVAPGDTVPVTFRVENAGATTAWVRLEPGTLPPGWTAPATGPTGWIALRAGEVVSTTGNVTVPADAPDRARVTFTVDVREQASAAIVARASVTITVWHEAAAQPAPPPGDEAPPEEGGPGAPPAHEAPAGPAEPEDVAQRNATTPPLTLRVREAPAPVAENRTAYASLEARSATGARSIIIALQAPDGWNVTVQNARLELPTVGAEAFLVAVTPGEGAARAGNVTVTVRDVTDGARANVSFRVHVADADAPPATLVEGAAVGAEGQITGGVLLGVGAATVAGAALAGGGFVRVPERVRYRWFALLAPLYTRLRREKVLDHGTRERVHALIRDEPGLYYRALADATGLPFGVLTYHLRVLERHKLVVARRDGRLKRFFPVAHDVRAVTPVVNDTQQRILDALEDGDALPQVAIAERVGASRQLVHHHVKALAKRGLVAVDPASGAVSRPGPAPADPVARAALRTLAEGVRTVDALASRLGEDAPRVERALAGLAGAGLALKEKNGWRATDAGRDGHVVRATAE